MRVHAERVVPNCDSVFIVGVIEKKGFVLSDKKLYDILGHVFKRHIVLAVFIKTHEVHVLTAKNLIIIIILQQLSSSFAYNNIQLLEWVVFYIRFKVPFGVWWWLLYSIYCL